jgi:hypothetical protein
MMKSEKRISSLKQDKGTLEQRIKDLLLRLERCEDERNELLL